MNAGISPIVCGTDFSACAIGAADVAARMARKLGTTLILVHSEEVHRLDPILRETIIAENRRKMDSEAERLRELDTELQTRLCSGSALDAILDVAEECNAQLLVIGAVGHGLARRLLIGSVAERVAEKSPIPTLIVRPKSRLISWLLGKGKLEVLVGHDFSATGDAALRWIKKVSVMGEIAVTVVHIFSPEEQNRTEQELFDRAAKILGGTQEFTVRVIPCWGNCEGALFEQAAQKNVDLIAVGTHQRRGVERLRIGSVSRALLHHATRSVAVIPPATAP